MVSGAVEAVEQHVDVQRSVLCVFGDNNEPKVLSGSPKPGGHDVAQAELDPAFLSLCHLDRLQGNALLCGTQDPLHHFSCTGKTEISREQSRNSKSKREQTFSLPFDGSCVLVERHLDFAAAVVLLVFLSVLNFETFAF